MISDLDIRLVVTITNFTNFQVENKSKKYLKKTTKNNYNTKMDLQ
jgi:hypothetical protein